MYKNSNSFVYVFVVNSQFFQITPSGYAENLHALSHKQDFSKQQVWDIFRFAFNLSYILI